MTKVLFTAPFPDHLMAKIRAVSPEIELTQMKLEGGKWPEGVTTDAEIYYAIQGIPPLDLAPNLQWVQGHWAGVDHLRDKAIWDAGVILTSASGVGATNLAQYTLAQLLYWANLMGEWQKYQALGEWPTNRWDKFAPHELRGCTIGILGYGSIGREIGRIAKTLGMTVLATKRNAMQLEEDGYRVLGTGDPKCEMADRIYPTEATRSMIKECDYVVITLPLTDSTHHLIDEDMLRGMKPGSVLINIGRGGIINELALIKALKKGWIRGASLDVFETEPLPTKSPLWKLDNLVITPHVSGFTRQYDTRMTDLFVENLRRYLAGEPLLNVVNREIGY